MFEYLSEDREAFYFLFPIKKEITHETLAWIQFVISKKYIKNLQRKSFITIAILLTSGWLIFLFIVYLIFNFYYKDLQKFQTFLEKLPYNKGIQLDQILFSKELNRLKDVINYISQILYIQDKNLQYEKNKIENILTFFKEGLILTDADFKIQYVNPSFCALTGYSYESIINKNLIEIFPILHPNKNSLLWDEVFPELITQESLLIDSSLKTEGIFFSPGGEKRFIEISISPIVFEDKIEGYIFGISDITTRKQLEQELLKFEKFETINRLAGGVAHDLNNLLAVLFNYLSLIKLNISNNKKEDCIKFIQKIKNTLNRAKYLSSQLLSLSKEGVPIKEPHDLEELIKDVAEFCFSGTPIKYNIIFQNPVRNILIDPQQMAQVFQNIFINAREAMPDGGKVNIEVSLKKLKHEEIPPLLEGDYVEIKISDTGLGIPPSILPNIFEPFFTTKEEGTGLGLAIAYQIIKKHGGNIIAENNPQGGAIFKIYLPYLIKDEPVEGKKSTPSLEISKKHYRILIIDDEEELRDSLLFLLSEMGYEVDTADNGKEGIEKYYKALKENNPFHVVITDYVLPDIKGDKVVAELKTIDPNAKVILSTGYTGIDVTSNYKNYGFSGILIKPYTFETLIQTIERTLSNS